MNKKILFYISIATFIGLILGLYIWLRVYAKDVILSSYLGKINVMDFYSVILDRRSLESLQIEILKDKKNLDVLAFSYILEDMDNLKKCHMIDLANAYLEEIIKNTDKEIEIKTVFGINTVRPGMADRGSMIYPYLNSLNNKCAKNEKNK